MNTDLENPMSSKSDDELQAHANNHLTSAPDAIEAARAEMQKRGKVFSNGEAISLTKEVRESELMEEKKKAASLFSSRKQWKKNVVEDENAPLFYSERAIYLFTVLFSVLFGSVLLANNIGTTETRKGRAEVVIFGIIYTGLQVFILSMIPRHSGLTIAFSICGAMILNSFFWKRYIGENTRYRARAVWKPLVIALLITIPLLILTIYSGNY